MIYKDLLKSYVEKSGLSLQEIANRITSEYGIGIDKSYISKLQNGKKDPASDELNKALATVTGGDVNELLTAAYIQKAPKKNFEGG